MWICIRYKQTNLQTNIYLYIYKMDVMFNTWSWHISVGVEPSQRASGTEVRFPVKPFPPNRPLYRSPFTMDLGGWSTQLTPNLQLMSILRMRGSTTPFPHTHSLLGASYVVSGSSGTLRNVDWYFRRFGATYHYHLQRSSGPKKKSWGCLTLENVKNMLCRNVENIYAA